MNDETDDLRKLIEANAPAGLTPMPKPYVDPIQVAWLTMHGALDEINGMRIGGTESTVEHEELSSRVPRSRHWLALTILIAECLRLGVPQFVWRRGRPTRLGFSVLAVILLLALLIQRSRYVAA